MKYKILSIIALFACMSFLTSCDDKDNHAGENGLAVSLVWEDPSDSGTPINDVILWVYDSKGNFVKEYHFKDSHEAASTLLPLPSGNYIVIGATNFVDPYTEENGDMTFGNLIMKLSSPSPTNIQAHYGVVSATVDGNNISHSQVSLRRILAELNIVIEGAPTGSHLSTAVTNTAQGFLPAIKDADGHYGVAMGNSPFYTLNFAGASEKDGKITDSARLMPTAANLKYTHLDFELRKADGDALRYQADAPIMVSGGKYTLIMQYADLRPYMAISVHNITNWAQGWIINGEILNPDNKIR